jgi:hypothetical protein
MNCCLDQAANMSMKIPVLGSAFGILAAAFIGAVKARDEGPRRRPLFPVAAQAMV